MRATLCYVGVACAALAASPALGVEYVEGCLAGHPTTLHEHFDSGGWALHEVIRDWTSPIVVDSETGPDEEVVLRRTIMNCGCSVLHVTIGERRSRTHHVGASGTASWSAELEAGAKLAVFAKANVKARAGIEFTGRYDVTRDVEYHITYQFKVYPGYVEQFKSSIDRYAARVHLKAYPAKWKCYRAMGNEWAEGTCGRSALFSGDAKGSEGTLDRVDLLGRCDVNPDCDHGAPGS